MAGDDPMLIESDDEGGNARETEAQREAWERAYEADRSWEELEEDESGRLRPVDPTNVQRAKRKRLLDAAAAARIRRGMIRYLWLVVDFSTAVAEPDIRPTRLAYLAALIPGFIRQFFAQNPLSQLGLMCARDGKAERISELSGSPEAHVAAFKAALVASGAFSLQNCIDQAVLSLHNIPPFGSREILIIQSSLSTADPGNIHASIVAAKKARCRVSVVGMGAEVHISRRATEETGGAYGVPLNESHLEELVMGHAPPPPALAESTAASLVRMGFPKRVPAAAPDYLCAGARGDFVCPRCQGRLAEIPGECGVCRLTCASSPHLARSYHHLFPVPPFAEIADGNGGGGGGGSGAGVVKAERGAGPVGAEADRVCFGCREVLSADRSRGVRVECGRCGAPFCFRCDVYVHESLHNCPGCEMRPPRRAG